MDVENAVTEGIATMQSGDTRAGDRDAVTVCLPATSAYLSVLRSVTAGLAAQLDFTLDEIEDLRIAVDEACGLLMSRPVAGGELECQFALGEDTMRARVSAPTADGAQPDPDSFAWHVLGALADTVEVTTDGGRRVSIVLHKRRSVVGRT